MNLKRYYYQIIHPIRKAYWFLVRPRTSGVKCIIEHNGKFLMIRNTYGHQQWTFPGGGIKSGESPEKAVRREVHEEVGVDLADVVPLGAYENTKEYKRDTVYCFYASVGNAAAKIDPVEIQEVAWFPSSSLPLGQSLGAARALRLLHNTLPQRFS